MSNNKNNNANVNENNNTVPATPEAEEKKEKIRLKDRIRNFGEKHPKLTKAGKYAVAVGAGALVALGGKSVLEALGGHPGASEYDYDGGEDPTTSAPAEPAEKEAE